jgi:quercetin dioxygenase-like cupin family protein
MFYALTAMGQSAESTHQLTRAADLKWTPSFMGCEHAAVSGDPSAEGKPFVLRIRCPDGAKVPPHWHPTDENMTVLEGTFMIGTGETFDKSKLRPMDAGSFILMPRTMRHFALCRGETVLQVHGIGAIQNQLAESGRGFCNNCAETLIVGTHSEFRPIVEMSRFHG